MHALLRTRNIVNRKYNVLKRCQICHNNLQHVYVSNLQLSTHSCLFSNIPALNVLLHNNTHIQYYIYKKNNSILARHISLSAVCFEKDPLKPSSQVEVTVQELKKQKEAPPATVSTTVVKKTMKQKVIDEVMHYYHGFRLLFIDIKISFGLVRRILNGNTLTRREYNLLTRTVGDLFRLVPFSVFIIIPFTELLIPVVIKFFPGILPSTFQKTTDKEDKLKQNLQVKLEMARFLQKTLDTMTVQHKDRSSQQVKEFTEWSHKVRTSGEQVSTEEIIKFSKLFEDEITLDSLSRSQLVALCRVLEVQTLGTNNLLRFQLRMKLRSLAADDKMIEKEGLDSLTLQEVQQACRARGMRAYGVSEVRLRSQLAQWLDLSLNQKLPPSLLLLSRALMLPETIPTSDKLKATISALPDTIITQTKVAIADKEGKIYNKVKLEVLKEEERKVKEERLEISEETKKEEAKEILVDKAPIVSAEATPILADKAKVITLDDEKPKEDMKIVKKDLEAIHGAVSEISKNKLIVEKEAISDLKAEMADYKEDIQEFTKAVDGMPKKDIKISQASKLLQKKVDKMITKMDTMLTSLEKQKLELKDNLEAKEQEEEEVKEHVLKIEDIVNAIKKIQNVDDNTRLEQIKKVLIKMDDDCDGSIEVEDVLKVVEMIGKDNVKLNDKQVDELIDLLNKEEIIEVENKIEKALQKEKEIQTSKIETEEIMEEVEPDKKVVAAKSSKIGSQPVPSMPISSIDPPKKKSDSKIL